MNMQELCRPQNDGKWNMNISYKFMLKLKEWNAPHPFDVEEAYRCYHHEIWTGSGDTYWMEVTVRQYISLATSRGILTRIRRGVYKFN